MKKTLISLAGLAGLGFAAMPVTGVFAEDAQTWTTVTESVRVTLGSSCTITVHTSADTTASIENGVVNSDITGREMSLFCNNASGWKLTAVGGDGNTVNTAMRPSGNGTAIETGTNTSGDTSSWAFKLAGTGVLDDFADFAEIPSAVTTVASGSGALSTGTVTPTYQVYASSTQAADTYTGQVTFTMAQAD